MSSASGERRPHVVLNLDTRYLKAKKIEELLFLPESNQPINLLEVGTGSAGIAHYFSTQSKYKVFAVDVIDSRLITDGFDFQLTEGVALPYSDEFFDVVISNHVIEHVGDYNSQMEHLGELKRVLKRDGVGYLAVPNRWMLIEPHYKLIFLSWVPHKWRSSYLKFFKKGSYYDCEPLEKHKMEKMFRTVGLSFNNLCIEALKLTFAIEKKGALITKIIRAIPKVILIPFTPVIPTLIYTFKK